jgi:hypothetical protein
MTSAIIVLFILRFYHCFKVCRNQPQPREAATTHVFLKDKTLSTQVPHSPSIRVRVRRLFQTLSSSSCFAFLTIYPYSPILRTYLQLLGYPERQVEVVFIALTLSFLILPRY